MESRDFIRDVVARDLEAGTYGGRVVTRFPPEPNGYLHIGHAKSIVLNFGIAEEVDGAVCHLRFDDTNPETEDERYVRSIQEDVRWLGYDWGERLHFASDYFEQMYAFAEHLIREEKAYVDSQSEEDIREGRGTISEPGTASPHRDRAAEESLDLFRRMRAGEFPNGAHVLRARIDIASPNMLLRDPVIYRIRHASHYRTGDDWCVYPLYDYAHPIEDAIECVTHSLCTLEFEVSRPLYDWVAEHWQTFTPPGAPERCRPRQYEFARLNLDFTVLSKRKLLALVESGRVTGWDDPRMPTLAGLRRRGVTPEAIQAFCRLIGVSKTNSRVDMGKLEYSIRDDLNTRAPRVLAVLRPLRVVITNYPEGKDEWLEAPYWPRDIDREGTRVLPFGREIYIERNDFMQEPEKGFRRLAPGREVRLRYAYFITCDEVVKDDEGDVVELRCRYDPATKGGAAPDGRKPSGTIHWVSARRSLPCEVRLYDRLFRVADPEAAVVEAGQAAAVEARQGAAREAPDVAAPEGRDAAAREARDAAGDLAGAGEPSEADADVSAEAETDFADFLNPDSLIVVKDARIEPSVADDPPDTRYQFERHGYFTRDPEDSSPDALVFNRIVTLRDTWAERAAREAGRVERGSAAAAGTARETSGAGRPSLTPEEQARLRREAAPERSPELEARRRRYADELGLSEEDAEILTREEALADFFEHALEGDAGPRAVANWVVNELPREIGERTLENLPIGGAEFGELVAMVDGGEISSRAGREVLSEMVDSGESPAEIVDRKGLRQVSDPDVLAPIVERVIAAHPGKAAEYREGKSGLIGFFMGRVMRESGGKADPELARGLLEERLNGT